MKSTPLDYAEAIAASADIVAIELQKRCALAAFLIAAAMPNQARKTIAKAASELKKSGGGTLNLVH
jgi:ribosomal silencing factor RsfS